MIGWLLDHAPILPLARVLATATAFPLMAGPSAPAHVRLAVAAALALVLVPDAVTHHVAAQGAAATFLATPFEVLLGFAIGYAFSLVFQVLAVAGEFAGQEMGLNTASQIDPATGLNVPLLARLFEAIGLLLFVEFGGYALMLRAVRGSFDLVPAGALLDLHRLGSSLADASALAIKAGVDLALPAGAVLLVLTVFTTICARVLPKLHIFDFAFALRVMLALVLVWMLLPRAIPILRDFADGIGTRLGSSLRAR